MASKPFEKMTKAELVVKVKAFKLEAKVNELALDPTVITNAEYVKVLNEFKETQAETYKETVKVEKVESKEDKFDAMIQNYFLKIPVIVTDHDNTSSVEDEIEGRIVPVSWGNKFTGPVTNNVALHGRMQYVARGALLVMEEMTYPKQLKDSNGKESVTQAKRFSIAEVDGWTEEELDAHVKEQALKKL